MNINLMSANITSSAAISSADLLTDLKSGYLLGANPRKQFIAQFCGIFIGTLATVRPFAARWLTDTARVEVEFAHAGPAAAVERDVELLRHRLLLGLTLEIDDPRALGLDQG
jgi:uncharacterized oligopeptide transporter (OPT) family protein